MTASRSTVYGSADGIAGSFRSHGRASLGTDHREAENTVIIANQELRETCFSSVASVRRMALIGSFATRAHDAFALRLALAQSYMREQGIGEHAAPGIHVSMVDGKARYTQVVTVSGTGKMIFVAGQLARDANGVCVSKGDMRAQIQQVGENIKTCLEAVGATLADIVKTNTYVTDYAEFAKHPDMRMRYFGPATPTSTTVQISRLADPDAMVEIEAIAVIDG